MRFNGNGSSSVEYAFALTSVRVSGKYFSYSAFDQSFRAEQLVLCGQVTRGTLLLHVLVLVVNVEFFSFYIENEGEFASDLKRFITKGIWLIAAASEAGSTLAKHAESTLYSCVD